MVDSRTAQRVRLELERGEEARRAGQEGRARVCARRAAGEAARAYFEQQGRAVGVATAYDLLVDLSTTEAVGVEIRQAAERLLTRVQEDYTLPIQADLLADARQIAEYFGVVEPDIENNADKETGA